MQHVKQIRTIVEAGDNDQAHAALDQLLALGPNNTEALKLRAALLEHEGRFADESKVWNRVATIDREDEDAINYFLRRQIEDREHFYFTEDLPQGGRRFLAYPRSLVRNAAIGLLGCMMFLASTRLSVTYPVLAQPEAMLGIFAVLVMGPWAAIVVIYAVCLRSVTISADGIALATRFRSRTLRWAEVKRVCLARSNAERGSQLALVILPIDGV